MHTHKNRYKLISTCNANIETEFFLPALEGDRTLDDCSNNLNKLRHTSGLEIWGREKKKSELEKAA